jgi:hypothetical protein
VLPEKFKEGDVSDCEIVALVERSAFGEDRGDDVVVMKSPDDKRFVVVLHPIGRMGVEVESNRSTYAGWFICACAQYTARTNVRRRVFMMAGKIESERSEAVC